MEIIQFNCNNSQVAQDLLLQYMSENQIYICGISEPARVQGAETWAVSEDKKCAILLRPVCRHGYKWKYIRKGIGFVMVEINAVKLVSCYFSPNMAHRDFKHHFLELEIELYRCVHDKVILFGDFNARSVAWRDKVNSLRRDYICDTLNPLNYYLCNSLGIATCNRVQGDSIIDLTFVNSKLRNKIKNWIVCDTETWPDHVMIKFMLEIKHKCIKGKINKNNFINTWGTKNINSDIFQAILEATLWCHSPYDVDNITCDEAADLFVKKVSYVCDQCLSKYRTIDKSSVYWWYDEIANLRSDANTRRRAWIRSRAKGNNREIANYRREYVIARKLLRNTIRKAKNNCWKELLRDIDTDPWDKPYRIVMNKLKPRGVNPLHLLNQRDVDLIVRGLFPDEDRGNVVNIYDDIIIDDNIDIEPITDEEISEFIAKMCTRKTAPGPNGLSDVILLEIYAGASDWISKLLNKCIETGDFPKKWKIARLVLLRKKNSDGPDPSLYRPLCLIDDIGKLLERILAARINRVINRRERFQFNGLHKRQFGVNRTTCDAITKLENVVKYQTRTNGLCLAVNLDIKNAFNSLSWPSIMNALAT